MQKIKAMGALLAVCALALSVTAQPVMAACGEGETPPECTNTDYGSLTTGFGAELTAALPVALAAVGLFIGVIMAYKVVRRVIRA